MKTIKVSEASGSVLDWLMAKCEGDDLAALNIQYPQHAQHYPKISPSTDWAQGGPIIEREITKIFRNVGGTWTVMILKNVPIPPEDRGTSLALTHRVQWNAAGSTPLIAAMRCYVASKMGDVVEVPDELL